MRDLPLPWRGVYFDGVSATRREAAFRLTAEALEFDAGDGALRRWTFREIRREVNAGRTTLHYYKMPYTGEMLVVDDPAAVRSLLAGPSTTPVRTHHLVVLGLVALLSLAVLIAAIPYAVGAIVALVPRDAEAKLGRAVVATVAPESERVKGPAVDRVNDRLRTRLFSRTGRPEGFEIYWIGDERANALAAPGGKMVAFCGLVRALQSGDQLAAVLAHEAAHVQNRHALRNLVRVLGVRVLLSLASGGLDIFTDSAAMLGALHYMRGDEEAADRDGLRLLLAAEVHPGAMADAFRRLQQEQRSEGGGRNLTYFSTHPDLSERIAQADRFAREHQAAPAIPVLTPSEWKDLQSACAAAPSKPTKARTPRIGIPAFPQN